MSLLQKVEALRSTMRRFAASSVAFEAQQDAEYFDALGTLAKEIAARGVVMTLPSIRVARPSGPLQVPFRWPLPSSAAVEVEADRTGKIATCEYRIALDASGVLSHSDFQIVKVMDAHVKRDPKNMVLAARAHAVAQKIPELVIDRSGAVVGPKDPAKMARDLERAGIPTDNSHLTTFLPLVAKFWYAWCQSFLGLPIAGPGSRGTVRVVHDLMGGDELENDAEFSCEQSPELAGFWVLTLESKLTNPPKAPLTRAVRRLVDDPELPLDDLLAQPTELGVHLKAVVDPTTFRPIAASRLVGAIVGHPNRPQGQEYESQVWTFESTPS
jgi:hypothetical protein